MELPDELRRADLLYGAAAVADELQCTRHKARHLIRTGIIKGTKLGPDLRSFATTRQAVAESLAALGRGRRP